MRMSFGLVLMRLSLVIIEYSGLRVMKVGIICVSRNVMSIVFLLWNLNCVSM